MTNYLHLYIVLAVLLISVLAMNVSRIRMQEQIGNGDGNNKKLKKAIRAHINTLEHCIPFALLLWVLNDLRLATSYIAVFSMGFMLVRLMHSYGILAPHFRMRQLAAGLCYGFEIAACATILVILF